VKSFNKHRRLAAVFRNDMRNQKHRRNQPLAASKQWHGSVKAMKLTEICSVMKMRRENCGFCVKMTACKAQKRNEMRERKHQNISYG